MKGLPRGVVEKRGSYYLRYRILGTETYIPLPRIDDLSFDDALDQARTKQANHPRPIKPRPRWPAQHHLSAKSVKKDRMRTVGYGAGEFTLTLRQLLTLARRADGHCEVTGLQFVHEMDGHRRRPFAPSIDRVDSAVGYRYSNVRIVCCCVNAALNEWGDDVFWTMVLTAGNGRWGTSVGEAVGDEPNGPESLPIKR